MCAAAPEIELSEKITDDVVIVAGVQRNLFAPATIDNCANHIDSLVSVEWRDLNGNNILDFGELPPEFVTQNTPSDGWLKVKANHWGDCGNRAGVRYQFCGWTLAHCRQTQQHGIIAQQFRQFGLC